MQQGHDPHDDRIVMPRSEQLHATEPSSGRIKGVEATSGGLVKATLGAAVAAGVILTLFWLPAEYGIDPTGAGRVLGLTQMGEIKQQLYAEAAADDTALAATKTPAPTSVLNDPTITKRLDDIEAQLASIAAAIGNLPSTGNIEAPTPATPALATPEPVASEWQDEMSYTLIPGQGIEIKLVMQEGERAEFAWSANGGLVNYDTHGDGGGQNVSYEKGRGVPDQTGTLTAAFTGNHGWFWRNRTNDDVVLTLFVRGEYSALVLPN